MLSEQIPSLALLVWVVSHTNMVASSPVNYVYKKKYTKKVGNIKVSGFKKKYIFKEKCSLMFKLNKIKGKEAFSLIL